MASMPTPRSPIRWGIVEYGLVRHGLVAALQRGRVRTEDVCDAHPELLRAARNIGRPSQRECPVCDTRTKEVTYVFGAKLPAGGTCPATKAELSRLERRAEPVICYSVEACVECGFHHLSRKWQAGGRADAARRQA